MNHLHNIHWLRLSSCCALALINGMWLRLTVKSRPLSLVTLSAQSSADRAAVCHHTPGFENLHSLCAWGRALNTKHASMEGNSVKLVTFVRTNYLLAIPIRTAIGPLDGNARIEVLGLRHRLVGHSSIVPCTSRGVGQLSC